MTRLTKEIYECMLSKRFDYTTKNWHMQSWINIYNRAAKTGSGKSLFPEDVNIFK